MTAVINLERRRLFGMAAVGVAAVQLGFGKPGVAAPRYATIRATPIASNSGFEPLASVKAGELEIGYAEAGPQDGPAVLLLHGWPYDIHSYVDVAPILAAEGYRVVIPHLRGYGTTRFLSDDTMRNGQQSAFAVDMIALMDALGINSAIIAGYDWGARTADIMAALWPERCRALVSVSGYLIGSQAINAMPLPPKAELAWWYQFYFATERGRLGYEANIHDFARLIWQTASPSWKFDDATFARSAKSLDNPDHVAITIHNYRWRLAWSRARRASIPMRKSSPSARRFRSPRSRWKATLTRHRIPIRPHMPPSSPASISTGRSPAGSDITCRRRRPVNSPKRWWMSHASEEVWLPLRAMRKKVY